MNRSIVGMAIAAVLALASSSALGATTGTIGPRMSLSSAQTILKKHGYPTGEKFALAIVANDPSHGLEFSELDDAITLVIEYDLETNQITDIGVVIIPEDQPKENRLQCYRQLLGVAFEKGGSFSLKFDRAERKKKSE